MQSPTKPIIHLRLTPHFDEDGASDLSVHLLVQEPAIGAGQPMFVFDTFMDNVPAPEFREEDIHAVDDQGPLALTFRDLPPKGRNTQQHWCVARATKGDVILTYDVQPRNVSIKTPLGARIDLRRDQGGLQAVGRWFMPLLISDNDHTNIFEWDLPASAPKSTRCVWSFGDGPGPFTRVGSSETVWKTVYMVGPVQSYPENIPAEQEEFAACYWFGSLLPNLDALKGYNTELFPKMAAHFGVTGETYRIFIRKSILGLGGTGFLGSYVLEYDDNTKTETDESLVQLFTHEMVHSFADLRPEEDGYDNAWYSEGIAELYSTFLPYRFGLRGLDFVKASVNSHLQTYFTSPAINMDIRQAAENMFSDWYAEWIPYKRGCAYLLFIDCYLRRKTGMLDLSKNGPLDEIIIDLSRRYRRGETVRSKDWLESLDNHLNGTDFPVEEHFRGMLRGSHVMDFAGSFLSDPSHEFVSCELRVLQFGFDRNSLRTRVMNGIQGGSPAAVAGVTDGAEIVSASSHSLCAEQAEASYRLVLKDGDRENVVEFLPRLEKTALAWQVRG